MVLLATAVAATTTRLHDPLHHLVNGEAEEAMGASGADRHIGRPRHGLRRSTYMKPGGTGAPSQEPC
jgi:hypothetical protein